MNASKSDIDPAQILHFWHQVEFFIPFDLEQQVLQAHDADWAVQRWSAAGLRRADQPLWHPALPPGRQLTGFDLYFGVFDKAELADVIRAVLRDAAAPDDDLEQDERGGLEGLTCMAKLRAGPAGELLLDDVSVSTAPWALGRIQHDERKLAALDFGAFQVGIKALEERLLEFRSERTRAALSRQAGAGVLPLSADDLLALQAIFADWAGFQPGQRPGAPAIVVHVRSTEIRRKKSGAPADPAPDEDDDDGADDALEIGILNSFFAQDIARAIGTQERGALGPALAAYLGTPPVEKRVDLYGAAGRDAILRALAPARLPAGHWLDEPAHALSLMQQFAVNGIFERLDEGGIFSVNGPPGTGKTTLLRDVFAEVVTRRARVLAGFAHAGEAFDGIAVAVDFQDAGRCHVRRLRKELTGFEMVVASSNNAAVENLSRDLPKAKALGKAWRDEDGAAKAGYLQTVAHNIAARTAKGDYATLAPDDVPWGLVACALGNKRNRSTFAFRLGVDESKAERPAKGFDRERHQSLWSWRDTYRGPRFADARAAFHAADTAVRDRGALLDLYADVCTRMRGHTRASFCADAAAALAQATRARDDARAALDDCAREQALCHAQMESLRADAALIEQGRPAWWLRWFQRARERATQADLADNRRQQRDWLARRRASDSAHHEADGRLRDAVSAHARAQQALVKREQDWDALETEHAQLAAAFPQMAQPASAADLEQPRWQVEGLWHDATLNALRSTLFAAALALHEAWLAEVLKSGGGFGPNVVALSHLLGGKRLQQREHALALWQSLFMIVPVVSSTFASIASQFRDLGADSLGWLFIDEAGQAVPQAAVGALWRARRAVVVGDPLQIEPVFTVPIRLIDALARSAGLPPARPVEPHLVSVQTLADEANTAGAWIEAQGAPQWIGSPLRVHRRCVDPMFTLANQIAYQGKMIFFDQRDPAARRPPAASLDLGPSAWVDLGGTARDKQVVPEQVELVCRAIAALTLRTGELPALYVISPFRRIKEALARKLSDPDAWPDGAQPAPRVLREWCRARIGTVHTFQGKEESLVWMVLGCDVQTRGAAAWAAGKPNLLNVALTRARHRFFLIGDAGLWGGLPYFAEASPALLPRIRPDVFLRRVRAGTVDAAPLES